MFVDFPTRTGRRMHWILVLESCKMHAARIFSRSTYFASPPLPLPSTFTPAACQPVARRRRRRLSPKPCAPHAFCIFLMHARRLFFGWSTFTAVSLSLVTINRNSYSGAISTCLDFSQSCHAKLNRAAVLGLYFLYLRTVCSFLIPCRCARKTA